MVKVTLVPTIGAISLAVLVTERSATGTGTGVTLLELLPGVGSYSVALMVAVF
ncbi:MAG: hypothetical protein BWY72_02430 [Bacteroidetes bacterium ADurb.Bin416]|nr:MAG: hypothetical protein BWY72_02430 [Bacteroidetes bacterium ADurb.Bin416]